MIDFGFAEVSPRKQRQYMDVAELLMSMSLVVGVKRATKVALQVVDRQKLIRTLPYLKREIFSGATSKGLRKRKYLLDELKQELRVKLDHDAEITEVDFLRINTRKVINIILIGVLIYIISCLTDFLDGFIARKFNLTSPFGAFLDPVADKVRIVPAPFFFLFFFTVLFLMFCHGSRKKKSLIFFLTFL